MGKNDKNKDAKIQAQEMMDTFFGRPLFREDRKSPQQFEYPKARCFVAIDHEGEEVPIYDYFHSKKDNVLLSYKAQGFSATLKIFEYPKEAEFFLMERKAVDPKHSYILGMTVDMDTITTIIHDKEGEGFGEKIAYAVALSDVNSISFPSSYNPKSPSEVEIIWAESLSHAKKSIF